MSLADEEVHIGSTWWKLENRSESRCSWSKQARILVGKKERRNIVFCVEGLNITRMPPLSYTSQGNVENCKEESNRKSE
jgi:hypothetical protein